MQISKHNFSVHLHVHVHACLRVCVCVCMYAGKSAITCCLCGLYTVELHYYGYPRD